MHVLYAFARIADDAIDSDRGTSGWKKSWWLDWVRHLPFAGAEATRFDSDPGSIQELTEIRPALVDCIARYRIPLDMLESLVEGMDHDSQGREIDTWDDLRRYAFRVASSVGICCTAIWTDGHPVEPSQPLWSSAIDCGFAFQLTNVLRDIREDAALGRVYLPSEDLQRFGLSRPECLAIPSHPAIGDIPQNDAWQRLLRVQIQRARGLFASGWQLHSMLDPDSFRMFSLMWHTYRRILHQIEQDPLRVLGERVRLSAFAKFQLVASHGFTPLLSRAVAATESDNRWMEPIDAPTRMVERPRVAVVGGGLAGMNAALELARHGCEVVIFEAKSRLGGRTGSFLDTATGQSFDYCQHVGMQCCEELRRWIAATDSTDDWRTIDSLHFVSQSGKRLMVRAWPLPAPFHLSGLIMRWPDLSLLDRMRISLGLSSLMLASPGPEFDSAPALHWLKHHFQNRNTIDRFWGTILVSALGEQIDRVAMGPVKKVLIDGFAATRDAFHLLVPTLPLSHLMDRAPRVALQGMNVDIRCGSPIRATARGTEGGWRLDVDPEREYDALVVAVPWHQFASVLGDALLDSPLRDAIHRAATLESSPITGVHTWWDRPWLRQPHAILIDRLCQWVFPGPHSESAHDPSHETYYQVVISGSRQLPRGDHSGILAAVEKELKELFPEASQSRLLRGRVVTDPQSVFSVSPGHATGRLSSNALASEGVFLAGDWIDTGWPATMEGALRSGLLAAQGTLAYFRRPSRLLD
jgi:squalene-associated FAD-dependent desaturase